MVNNMINFSNLSTIKKNENCSSVDFKNRYLGKTDFLQKIIETLADGILILSNAGKILYANTNAIRICSELNRFFDSQNSIPSNIWYICECLIESKILFPGKNLFLSDEIGIDKSTILSIKVRSLDLDRINKSCLLVTIGSRYEF